MKDGYIKIYRSIWNSENFSSEPFCQRSAFIWLVSSASWRDCCIRYKGARVSLKRGQLAISIRDLADKWQWHRARVERFLGRLKIETVIETQNETGVTVITICNYDRFQSDEQHTETPTETVAETEPRHHRDTEQEVKKVRKEEVVSKTPTESSHPFPQRNGVDIDDAFAAYNRIAVKHGLPKCSKITSQRRGALLTRLKEFGDIAIWYEALSRIGSIPGLLGDSNGGWKVSIDFLLKPGSVLKIVEGRYDNWGTGTETVVKHIHEHRNVGNDANQRLRRRLFDKALSTEGIPLAIEFDGSNTNESNGGRRKHSSKSRQYTGLLDGESGKLLGTH